MLATPVLATGITHLTDARYFAAWEVAYLAFPVEGAAPDAISWDYLAALREWVAGPEIVVELAANVDAALAAETLSAQNVHLALVPFSAPASTPEKLVAAGITVFAHLPVEGYQQTEDVAENLAAHPGAERVVLDFTAGGIGWADLEEGHPFTLSELRELLNQRPCFLRIDLENANPKSIAADYPLAGMAVRGSSEEKVGYKSFDDLDGLFEGLEIFE